MEMNQIKAWKDVTYREQVGGTDHPSGSPDCVELDDLLVDEVVGAATGLVGTFGCCWCVPWYSGWTVCGLLCDHPGCS